MEEQNSCAIRRLHGPWEGSSVDAASRAFPDTRTVFGRGCREAAVYVQVSDTRARGALWCREMTRGLAAAMALAAQQHGVVTTANLHRCGFGPTVIARLARAGVLRRRHRGVYLLCSSEPPHARAMAALLACGPDAALSHPSAAAIWEIRPATDDVIHVIHPGSARKHAGVRAHRMELQPRDVTRRMGMRVTRPARTLLDLASMLEARELARAVEEAQVRRLVNPTELRELVARASLTQRGVPALRRVLDAIGDRPSFTRSEAERRLVELIRAARLPQPRANARVARHEVDLLWVAQRLVVEVDGFRFHGGRAAFERDRRRDGELLAAGYRVLRLTWRELTDAPEAVVATLAQALAAAAGR